MLICSCYVPSTFISAGRPSRSSSSRQPSSQRHSSRPRPAPSAAQPVPPTITPADSANTAAPATGRRAARQGRQHPYLKGLHRLPIADGQEDRHRQRVAYSEGQRPQVLDQREHLLLREIYTEDRTQVYVGMSSGSPTTLFRSGTKVINMGDPGEMG